MAVLDRRSLHFICFGVQCSQFSQSDTHTTYKITKYEQIASTSTISYYQCEQLPKYVCRQILSMNSSFKSRLYRYLINFSEQTFLDNRNNNCRKKNLLNYNIFCTLKKEKIYKTKCILIYKSNNHQIKKTQIIVQICG